MDKLGISNISYDQAARYIYPGALINALLMLTKHSLSLELSILILLLGLLIYPFYRATFWFLIRLIMSKLGFIPQYEMHKMLIDELNMAPNFKKYYYSTACMHSILQRSEYADFKKELSMFNSLVHVLYMTSFVLLIFFMGLFYYNHFTKWIYSIGSGLSFFGGILLDRYQADMREYVFMLKNKYQYINTLNSLR